MAGCGPAAGGNDAATDAVQQCPALDVGAPAHSISDSTGWAVSNFESRCVEGSTASEIVCTIVTGDGTTHGTIHPNTFTFTMRMHAPFVAYPVNAVLHEHTDFEMVGAQSVRAFTLTTGPGQPTLDGSICAVTDLGDPSSINVDTYPVHLPTHGI